MPRRLGATRRVTVATHSQGRSSRARAPFPFRRRRPLGPAGRSGPGSRRAGRWVGGRDSDGRRAVADTRHERLGCARGTSVSDFKMGGLGHPPAPAPNVRLRVSPACRACDLSSRTARLPGDASLSIRVPQSPSGEAVPSRRMQRLQRAAEQCHCELDSECARATASSTRSVRAPLTGAGSGSRRGQMGPEFGAGGQ